MPSGNYTSYYDQSDRPEYHYDYDDEFDYEEEYWCYNCQSQIIFMKGLCECCRNINLTDRYGLPTINNEYWLNSPCDIGQKLRQKCINPLNIKTQITNPQLPPPFYLPNK